MPTQYLISWRWYSSSLDIDKPPKYFEYLVFWNILHHQDRLAWLALRSNSSLSLVLLALLTLEDFKTKLRLKYQSQSQTAMLFDASAHPRLLWGIRIADHNPDTHSLTYFSFQHSYWHNPNYNVNLTDVSWVFRHYCLY